MRLVFTVVGFQIRVNHFFPTLFRGETNTSSGAKTQCGSNVVEHVPKENLGKGETMPGGLVEVLLRCFNIRDGVPLLLVEPQGSEDVTKWIIGVNNPDTTFTVQRCPIVHLDDILAACHIQSSCQVSLGTVILEETIEFGILYC